MTRESDPLVPEETRRRIESLLREEFLHSAVGPETDLEEHDLMELLDSVRVLQLCGALEDRFGIAIADEEITVENLETLDRIVALVHRKRRGAG